ncbi:MAG: uracil-DNA glycosylase [Spirochaetia bacterium]|nr:uracil-DNA glycosylase [Spirochaetia bacterium]
MNDIQQKRDRLSSCLSDFVHICDEAEALLTKTTPVNRSEEDFSDVLDTLLPLPVDKQSIKGTNLKQLEQLVNACDKCRLCQTRNHTVFGEGVVPASLMVIGEGPGAEEDATGRAFVGKAGKYLDTWLKAISMSRSENVYIANIVKCRPVENRNPYADEIASCMPYLKRQIQLVRPNIILLVGSVATRCLLNCEDGVTKMRGRFHRWEGIPVVVTYHPAGVLRNQELRRPVWDDLKKVAAFLNIQVGGAS